MANKLAAHPMLQLQHIFPDQLETKKLEGCFDTLSAGGLDGFKSRRGRPFNNLLPESSEIGNRPNFIGDEEE
jgi:hypothetical protein